MTTETIVKVGDYEVSHTNGTHFVARRNGQLWRDLTGDNLVLALVSRIDQLEKAFTQPTLIWCRLAWPKFSVCWTSGMMTAISNWGMVMTRLVMTRHQIWLYSSSRLWCKLPKAGE